MRKQHEEWKNWWQGWKNKEKGRMKLRTRRPPKGEEAKRNIESGMVENSSDRDKLSLRSKLERKNVQNARKAAGRE